MRPRLLRAALALVLVAAATGALRAATNPSTTERFRYTWQLRGGLAWIASLRFPTSGNGELRTTRISHEAAPALETVLRITANEGNGYYLYQSHIDERTGMTLMTFDGYQWGDKARSTRTVFDYAKRLARTHEESPEKVKDRVRPIPHEHIRDVLTAIHHLRQNAATITTRQNSSIYSNGKLYPVVFEPAGSEALTIDARRYSTRSFRISASSATQKKWPGAVKVWLSADAAAVPVRIEIVRNLATLRLDLDRQQ